MEGGIRFSTSNAGESLLSRAEITPYGHWNYEGHQLKNIADPVDAQDAVTLSYFEANSAASIASIKELQETIQAQAEQIQTLKTKLI